MTKRLVAAAVAVTFAGTMLASPADAAERQDQQALYNSNGESCNSLHVGNAIGAPNDGYLNANATYDGRLGICVLQFP